MSACAGSLTDASCSIRFRCRRMRIGSCTALQLSELPGPQEKGFKHSPARPRWIAPGRIESMSTQRREDRTALATESRCRGSWSRLRLASCKDRVDSLGIEIPAAPARNLPAIAAGRTAPLVTPAMSATNSLPTDYRNRQPAGILERGSPPLRQAAAQRPPRLHRFGYPPIFSPALCALAHLALPCVYG